MNTTVAIGAPTTTKTTSIATAFTRKLYRMLDIEDAAVIGWDATGLSFTIHDDEELDSSILPRYFRGRVDVFRQHLNEHGFQSTKTVVGQKQVETFFHKHFVRGDPNQLNLIVRTPTNKRRRSRLGKKRTRPEVPASTSSPHEQVVMDELPSFVSDDNFNFCEYLQGQSVGTTPVTIGKSTNQTSENDALHNSLANILALHAMNPVISSRAMLDEGDGRRMGEDQIDTPQFSFEMMASMVEWLDTTA